MNAPWRTGRRNPLTIYEQTGPHPADTDRYIGSLRTEEDTQQAVDAVNTRIVAAEALVELATLFHRCAKASIREHSPELADTIDQVLTRD